MKKQSNAVLPAIAGTLLIVALVIVAFSAQRDGSSDEKDSSGGSSPEAEQYAPPIAPVYPVTESEFADVDPIELPEISPIEEAVGFKPVQAQKLSDEYVLQYTELGENSITYKYQKHIDANDRKLYLSITKMSEEEYTSSLPVEKVREYVDIDGREAVYANRTLYRIPKDEEIPDDAIELKEEKEGTAVIERSDVFRELSQMQTLDWYENGCKYELFADYLNLTSDKMVELALNYYRNGV